MREQGEVCGDLEDKCEKGDCVWMGDRISISRNMRGDREVSGMG